MIIYTARHGQTEWNALHKVCGRTDVDLTPEGYKQAEALAENVSGCRIHMIYSSPLRRAVETSRIISERMGIPYFTDNRLMEQDYGIYEGVDRKNEDFLRTKKNFAFRYPSGESMMQTAVRVYGLLDEIREKEAGKNVLLVSHGGVCRVIRSYFVDMTNEEYFNYTQKNGALEVYEYR